MTSERITNLQQRIATSRREVELKEKQAEEEKQRQEAKLEARRAQNIQKLEETGVVVFFREVQKAGILRKNSTPV
ncbi:hypothetical protein KKA02_00045, partial [Patescibacteria group bacterium]|nr:hypothetical protein [Patescibacteria group bacterium]